MIIYLCVTRRTIMISSLASLDSSSTSFRIFPDLLGFLVVHQIKDIYAPQNRAVVASSGAPRPKRQEDLRDQRPRPGPGPSPCSAQVQQLQGD